MIQASPTLRSGSYVLPFGGLVPLGLPPPPVFLRRAIAPRPRPVHTPTWPYTAAAHMPTPPPLPLPPPSPLRPHSPPQHSDPNCPAWPPPTTPSPLTQRHAPTSSQTHPRFSTLELQANQAPSLIQILPRPPRPAPAPATSPSNLLNSSVAQPALRIPPPSTYHDPNQDDQDTNFFSYPQTTVFSPAFSLEPSPCQVHRPGDISTSPNLHLHLHEP